MLDILVDWLTLTLALLGIEHVPKEAEPFVEKATVRYRRGDIGCGKICRALGVHAILGVGVHAITEIASKATITISSSILCSDIWICLKDCTRAVELTIAHEVLVDIGIEQCST